MGSVQLYK